MRREHGVARDNDEIIAEYQAVLEAHPPHTHAKDYRHLWLTPARMCRRLEGKPIQSWTDADLLSFYRDRPPNHPLRGPRRAKLENTAVSNFACFLLLRGYLHLSIDVIWQTPLSPARLFPSLLDPYRRDLEAAGHSGLWHAGTHVGSILNLLVWFLARAHKPLHEVTRADWEGFRTAFQQSCADRSRVPGATGPKFMRMNVVRLNSLDKYLVARGYIAAPAPVVSVQERRLAQMRSSAFRAADQHYAHYCTACLQLKSAHDCA
jgi:hypothetical protein